MIDAAIAVHKRVGPGLLKSTYENCLRQELASRAIPLERQFSLPIEYHGIRLECGDRIDIVIARPIIVELKSLMQVLPVQQAQLPSRFELSGLPQQMILHFNVHVLK